MTEEVAEEQAETQKVPIKMSLKRIGRVYGTMLGLAWTVARGRALGLFASVLYLSVGAAFIGFATKLVLDPLQEGDADRALAMGILYLVLVGGNHVVSGIFGLLQFDMGDRITHELDRRLMGISAGIPGLDHLERPEFADKLKLIRERTYIPNEALYQLNALAYVIIGIVATVVILGFVHPLLALTPVVALPSGWLQYRSSKKHLKQHDDIAPEDRLAYHFVELTTGIKAAKEIRLFGLGPHLVARHKRITDAFISKLFKDRVRRSGVGLVSGLMYGASLAGSIGFLGWLALEGRATLGDVAMGIQVIRMAIGRVEMAAEMVAWTAELSFMGERYLWLFDYKSSVNVLPPGDQAPLPDPIVKGITIEDVHFTYPGTDKKILDGVSLFIPAGSIVALVGENGAGKTSLVKLLSRFYDPDQGSIRVDDVELAHIDVEAWRSRAAVAFQDFVKFQLIAREAIGVGELAAMTGDRIAAAAHQAGATRIINRLPDGIDTQLGKDFEGGIELSEGEWQRIALARGSMRKDPLLLILDEPTASLDARAEHEVFERFAEMARPENGPHPTAILVSHRFSTVRMADLIVVLHDGKIEEIGSHDELMAQGRRYAELFDLQASRYD